MRLTSNETTALFAAIEDGRAALVRAAAHKHIDAYGEVSHEDNFYYLDNKVFNAQYINRIASTECYEVTGDNLDMFKLYYKLGEYAA